MSGCPGKTIFLYLYIVSSTKTKIICNFKIKLSNARLLLYIYHDSFWKSRKCRKEGLCLKTKVRWYPWETDWRPFLIRESNCTWTESLHHLNASLGGLSGRTPCICRTLWSTRTACWHRSATIRSWKNDHTGSHLSATGTDKKYCGKEAPHSDIICQKRKLVLSQKIIMTIWK